MLLIFTCGISPDYCAEGVKECANDNCWAEEDDGNVASMKGFRQLDQAARIDKVGERKNVCRN